MYEITRIEVREKDVGYEMVIFFVKSGHEAEEHFKNSIYGILQDISIDGDDFEKLHGINFGRSYISTEGEYHLPCKIKLNSLDEAGQIFEKLKNTKVFKIYKEAQEQFRKD
ncbi:MAG: hypothetical protein V3V61_03755 [Gammaproteobacteria bacterium]